MSSSPPAAIRQDLPPPGGYKPINWKRIPAKTYFKGRTIFLTWAVVHFTGSYLWVLSKRKLNRFDVEARSGNMAINALLQAEKDRNYLKHLRKLRDDETELMKDVPGWEVGTYYGDKIYHTRPADSWNDITLNEYYTHTYYRDLMYHCAFYKYV